MQPTTLLIHDLLDAYKGGLKPALFIARLLDYIDANTTRGVWINRLERDEVLQRAAVLEGRSPDELPLYGVPFAIKDNIDLAGVPTTAACPDYAYTPGASAFVVQQLIDAGAIPIGKTNLDQFAAGLVGTRSPYGACPNAFDPAYISGGSSSGSAVAVAKGFVSFALGTDTAGSGRVPAGFNNIVGLKPSCGRFSTRGVVPACRSLDCVSIFTGSAQCAEVVLKVAGTMDEQDPFARPVATAPAFGRLLGADPLTIGVPRREQLQFFGDSGYAQLFDAAIEVFERNGVRITPVDFMPFIEAAQLLYQGPWLAERFVAIQEFIEQQAESLYPVTRTIIEGGRKPTAAEAFKAQYRLQALRRTASSVFGAVDVLLTPTAGTIFRIDEVNAKPVELNTQLGYYTNYMNLLDLAAVAVPAGFRRDGLPFGITLAAPRGYDEALLGLAGRVHPLFAPTVGATHQPTPLPRGQKSVPPGFIPVVVCGAHMQGLPLNHQLRERNAYFVRRTRTAPLYRFYALSGGPPRRPGLVRVSKEGAAIEVEVWAVPAEHFGTFVAGIPSPLGIGKVLLEDGSVESGFICEASAVDGAQDITALGSWRTYMSTSA
ncbi:MAG: allophanate hydrolase [Steroidobacteraceae bacterium]